MPARQAEQPHPSRRSLGETTSSLADQITTTSRLSEGLVTGVSAAAFQMESAGAQLLAATVLASVRRAVANAPPVLGGGSPNLRMGPASAVIVEPRDAEGVPTAPTVRRLRGELPLVPALAYCPFTQPDARDLLDVVQAGVSDLPVRGVDDASFALDSALAAAEDECTAQRAMGEIGRIVAGRTVQCSSTACRTPAPRPQCSTWPAPSGMHSRTLSPRLARAGLPPGRSSSGGAACWWRRDSWKTSSRRRPARDAGLRAPRLIARLLALFPTRPACACPGQVG
jgi:hypothetical protein